MISLLALIFLAGLPGSLLYAQNDSLEITVVPLAEIANAAASDMQQARDFLVDEVQVNTGFKLIPQIDSLETGVAQLDLLTRQMLDSRLDYSYYSSLILRWERQEAMADPLQVNLQKYLADVEEIKSDFEGKLAKWELTLEETDPSVLSEDIASRIQGISFYIDSSRLILNDSLNSSLALLNQVADLKLVIENNLHDIGLLQKQQLGQSILAREESIFRLGSIPDSTYFQGDRMFLLTMGIEDTKVYLNNEWPTLVVLLFSFIVVAVSLA